MDGSGYLATAEVEKFLAFARTEARDIAFELRNIIYSICPEATERILWGTLSYHDSSKGGPVKGAICQIGIETDQVRISFIHGVRLKDQDSLLRGNQLSKRSIVIDSYDQAPWDSISVLIKEAGELDPSTFGSLSSVTNGQ